jgi:hypothetical protein
MRCYKSELWIRIHPGTDPDPAFQVNPDQGFDDQKLKKKKYSRNFLSSFFNQKLQFTYVQATGEAFSPQKRTLSSSINAKFVGNFLPSWIRIRIPDPDTDPGTPFNPDPIRIRIHRTVRTKTKCSATLSPLS